MKLELLPPYTDSGRIPIGEKMNNPPPWSNTEQWDIICDVEPHRKELAEKFVKAPDMVREVNYIISIEGDNVMSLSCDEPLSYTLKYAIATVIALANATSTINVKIKKI